MEKDTPPKFDVLRPQDSPEPTGGENIEDVEKSPADRVIFDLGHVQRAKERLSQLSAAPASRGATAYTKYLTTGEIGLAASVLAKCCECSGFYFDGRDDCGQSLASGIYLARLSEDGQPRTLKMVLLR